jgi:hypothetical protein
MIGELITLPLRLSVRGTQLALRTAEGIAERVVSGALQATHLVSRNGGPAAPPEPAERSPEPAERSPEAPDRPEPGSDRPRQRPPARVRVEAERAQGPPARDPAKTATAPPPPVEVPPPAPPAPMHVSEEPVLVREEAEPGAEDGAGASIRIDPPWDGYGSMGAREVIARLEDADAAALATVQLYESMNRSRQTVLQAVERRLKAANRRG